MAAAHALIDHDEIRRWAEERGARPACVRGTGRKGGVGMIRLDLPGFTGEESLEQISWDEWFRQFEENRLALLVQEETARGQRSNFNKLISREAAEGQVTSRRRARQDSTPARKAARAPRKTASAARRTGAARPAPRPAKADPRATKAAASRRATPRASAATRGRTSGTRTSSGKRAKTAKKKAPARR